MLKTHKKTLSLVVLMLFFNKAALAQQPENTPLLNAVNSQSNEQSPLIKGVTPTLVSDNLLFLEGPTWSSQDNAFYFSEMNFASSQALGPDSTIYKLVLPNTLTTYLKHSGTNGLYAKGQNLYTLNHSTQSLSKINIKSKTNTVIVSEFDGLSFSSPNDMTMHKNGDIFFTDPNWQIGERTQQMPYTGVYKLSNTGVLSLIDATLEKPNGVALSPDQRTLYVGDFSNRVSKYTIDENGDISPREDFIKVTSPDGIKVDSAGNIYVSSHKEGVINIYTPSGLLIDKIELGPNVTNLAFGGKNRKTLLITTAKGLFTLDVKVAGLAN
ncbi:MULTISPECIES: SMP-30/gluconolactonase/LRE family protein [unclassified Pseudoalteromonas]|uniref:SMP-30/gluconolactonase/LRE family protein n=1 Tax=unclassified Pseudoalteromonas TaxID=194690 RepID=UPI0018CE873D|nr:MULTISPECIES: SMP-30/gluconolactonase/LRE family protein [unclassified Pseudoalteromonas]MBH0012016.1 SMP-30/gluconolactonase/LRE family protein [Pseudoalteromonas sp. NZS100_1]MBH0037193.1 SMP-30/gluconolactonase/LRE family protein [Pseudoalteromonas sp. SWN166]